MSSSLDEIVLARHADEPRIASELIAMLRAAKARGQRVGFRAAWEALRWRADVELTWCAPFRLNNNHMARFARIVLILAPDLAGAFSLRALKDADANAFERLARARLALPAPVTAQLELPLAPRPVARRVTRPRTIASLGQALAAMDVAKRILHATRRRAA